MTRVYKKLLPKVSRKNKIFEGAFMPRFQFAKRTVALVVLAALLLAGGLDLFYPVSTDLRDFNADEVAHLDTIMWRSYYERERVKLFLQLAELLRVQFDLPWLRSYVVAFHAAKAAFVFKDGRARADYEKALPDLIRYYRAIRNVSTTHFDVEQEAKLELEWWIVHRQRDQHAPGDLDRALAEAAAELYRVPAEKLMEYVRLRTEAMNIRDHKAVAGGVTEEDWKRIEELLQGSWRALWQAVR
jgi:hypothetical protein